jgi:hypothetical protein
MMNKHRYLLLLMLVCLPYRASALIAEESGQLQESSLQIEQEASQAFRRPSPVKHCLHSREPVVSHTEDIEEADVLRTTNNESQASEETTQNAQLTAESVRLDQPYPQENALTHTEEMEEANELRSEAANENHPPENSAPEQYAEPRSQNTQSNNTGVYPRNIPVHSHQATIIFGC